MSTGLGSSSVSYVWLWGSRRPGEWQPVVGGVSLGIIPSLTQKEVAGEARPLLKSLRGDSCCGGNEPVPAFCTG